METNKEHNEPRINETSSQLYSPDTSADISVAQENERYRAYQEGLKQKLQLNGEHNMSMDPITLSGSEKVRAALRASRGIEDQDSADSLPLSQALAIKESRERAELRLNDERLFKQQQARAKITNQDTGF